MTLGGELQALGMREVRERIRAVVARVADGSPLVIMQHGDPAAVLIRFDEAERWGRVERALAALHALEVYPELVRGTGQLGAAVRGELQADAQRDPEPRRGAARDPGAAPDGPDHRPARAARDIPRGSVGRSRPDGRVEWPVRGDAHQSARVRPPPGARPRGRLVCGRWPRSGHSGRGRDRGVCPCVPPRWRGDDGSAVG